MRPENYSAAIYKGKGSVAVETRPYPECGDDDVIVKNLIAGICGGDIGAYYKGGDAHMIWKDHEFGHEMVSEVVEIGKNVKGLSIGDHVFPNMGNAFRDRMRMATVGGFSEYIKIIQCEVGFSLIKIDNDIPAKTAILLEPFVIGTRVAESLKPGPGKTCIVLGCGIIGLSAAIMSKWYGCDKVMVVDISDKRLSNAANMGLITCNPQKEDLKEKAFAEFGSAPGFGGNLCAANSYIDAIGTQDAIDYFCSLAGREASLGVVGTHHEIININLLPLCYNNWRIGGCGNITINAAAEEIFKMMKSGKFDLTPLVSHEFKLEQINDAIKTASNPAEAQKVCISY